MLISFKMKNYKSFVDEVFFSMSPAPKQTGLDYSVLKQKAGNKTRKALCSAVVYGPNASGKTNIIGAMDTLRSIVLRGNIRNADSEYTPNVAATTLEMIPNCDTEASPTELSIVFVEKGYQIEYSLTMELGPFLEKSERKVICEKLRVNDKDVFTRGKELEIALPSVIRPLCNKTINRITQKLKEIAENSLSETELFLTNGFKSIFAQELVSLITEWFQEKFIVIYRSDRIKVIHRVSDPKENTIYVGVTLTKAAKEFGINSNALGYRNRSDGEPELCSVFENRNKVIPAEYFESYGTIRFVNEFPLVMDALLNGGTLVMDEFDASIHPMALMNIISIFHNDEININHAQLIFNSHNPIFLDASLFRRDEIKFVERDENTNRSIHYSLSDFKTSDGIRKGEDYMSNYFVNRYGAIKEVDFSQIVRDIVYENRK